MKNNLQRQKDGQYNQMKDKTKGQLIKELAEMRQRIIEQEAERKRVKKMLRLHTRELSTLNKLARSLSSSLGLSEVMKTGRSTSTPAICLAKRRSSTSAKAACAL